MCNGKMDGSTGRRRKKLPGNGKRNRKELQLVELVPLPIKATFFIERSFACRYGCREQLASSSMLVLACVCVSFAPLSAILLLLVGRRSFRYHFGLIHPGDTAAAAMLLELLFLSTVSRRKGSYFFGVPSLWSALMDGTSSDLSQPAPSSFSGSAR